MVAKDARAQVDRRIHGNFREGEVGRSVGSGGLRLARIRDANGAKALGWFCRFRQRIERGSLPVQKNWCGPVLAQKRRPLHRDLPCFVVEASWGVNSGAVTRRSQPRSMPRSSFVIGANPTVNLRGGTFKERGKRTDAKLIVIDPRRQSLCGMLASVGFNRPRPSRSAERDVVDDIEKA